MKVCMYLPKALSQPSGEEAEWGCTFEVERANGAYRATARGAGWLEVVLIAMTGIRQQVPEAEENDWQTPGGIPFWLRFPQQVPVSWGYKPYRFMCDQIGDAMSDPTRRDWSKPEI
jgi:hypothetical protein